MSTTYQTLVDDYVTTSSISAIDALCIVNINQALRWCFAGDDSYFAWPQTIIHNASVTVTDGVIAWSDVASADWVSFWRSDPRLPISNVVPGIPYWSWGWNPSVLPVPVCWDGAQFNVQDTSVSTPVFAFYRIPTPQATLGGGYTAAILPFMRDPVVRYALGEYYSALGSMEREQRYNGKAVDWYDSNKAAILNSEAGYPWQGNIIIT